MSSSKLSTLQKWFEDNKLQWDKDSFEITEATTGSFGVRALKDVAKDKSVVKIPKECILSIKTCGISNILDEAGLEGGCPLALAVLYEMAQGIESPWFGYLQSLPKNEDLPIFWSSDEKAVLKGTEIDAAIKNDMDDLEDDYKEIIQPLLEAYPYIFNNKEDYSFEKFLNVTSLISSRAFQVDAYHENALVPFADLFNHDSNEHVHFETEFEVCDACGVLEYCEHQYLDMLESDEEAEMEKELLENGNSDINEDEDIEDKEDLEEEDIENESEEEEEDEEMEEDTELPDLEELEKAGIDFWDSSEADDTNKIDTCDMVLDRDVLKNEEVFNTYGDHPNIALLSKYGFCYDDNKNDFVSVSEDALIDCCIALTMENIKSKYPQHDDTQLESLAVEFTRSRFEFFSEHEQTLFPSEKEEDQYDDYEEGEKEEGDECQDGCCSSGNKEHDHHEEGAEHDHTEEDDEEHDHEHKDDGGCCGGDDSSKSKPYYINSEGLFEDRVMCLLHIMFVDEDTFEGFTKDFGNALEYFELLSNGGKGEEESGKKRAKKTVNATKHKVNQLCHALVNLRRNDYLDESGEWKPISEDIKEREKMANNGNMRKFYGLTCRISEKKIIERALSYYESLFKTESKRKTASSPKKEAAHKNKRRKL